MAKTAGDSSNFTPGQTQPPIQQNPQSYGQQGNSNGTTNNASNPNTQGRGYGTDNQSYTAPRPPDQISLPPINVRTTNPRPDSVPPNGSTPNNNPDDLDLPPFLKKFKNH